MKNRKSFLAVLLTLMLVFTSVGALALTKEVRAAEKSPIDLNGDGKLSISDYLAFLRDYRNCKDGKDCNMKSDINSDGKVSATDYREFIKQYLLVKSGKSKLTTNKSNGKTSGESVKYAATVPQPPSDTDIPKCPDSEHDDRTWHGLYNPDYGTKGCHFTHEHHDDPHQLDSLFGKKIFDWAGGEISYPWQTFHGGYDNFEMPMESACLENDCKHPGYKWHVIKDKSCDANDLGVTVGANNCITDARVQAHMIFSQFDALVRFHSLLLEARVCKFGADPKECGTFRMGGWLDTGKLNLGRGNYVYLPGDPAEFAEEVAEAKPYRIHFPVGEKGLDSWNTGGNYYNYVEGLDRLYAGFGVHVLDAWGGVDPDNKEKTDLYCPDFKCKNNNSEAALFRVWVEIPRELDETDGKRDGFYNGSGYVNRYGDIQPAGKCKSISLDCIPFEAINVPVRVSRYRGNLVDDNKEYDTSPSGKYWIEYPN